MIERARELTQMMGYNSIDETLNAIAEGELILVKVPSEMRIVLSRWLHRQMQDISNVDLKSVVDDLADSIDMAAELKRYPVDTDVCEMDLPNGWPSYCDKSLVQ